MNNLKSKILNLKSLLILLLFILVLGERVMFDFGPNIELVTVSMLLIAFYLGTEKSLWFTLLVMIFSDLFLGNTNIFLFTWSGFLIPVFLSGRVFSRLKANSLKLTASATGIGIGATLFFFLWTNFGVWMLDSWGMYSNDLNGLVASYVNALPFLKNHLISTLVFVPMGFGAVEFAKEMLKWKNISKMPGVIS